MSEEGMGWGRGRTGGRMSEEGMRWGRGRTGGG